MTKHGSLGLSFMEQASSRKMLDENYWYKFLFNEGFNKSQTFLNDFNRIGKSDIVIKMVDSIIKR